MRYGILGTTQAHRDDGRQGDGRQVPLGGGRLRALLAALALRPGRPVPTSTLVDEVWDGSPPSDADAALQALVGRLRKVLGPEEIGTEPGGYVLVTDPEQVDLGRFERLAAEGARAAARGDQAAASATLREALDLWRGPALADLPGRAAASARCDALRLAALRRRIGADLALGRSADVLPELAELSREHPLDEPLRALLIRALDDSGRTADALAEYEQARRELAGQLGTDPGPELRALHAVLLDPERASGPGPHPGAGAAQAVPRPRAPERSAPGNLRTRLTSFVGRERELAALPHDLASARLITLTGPGGSGKTRLSQEAAERAAADWPDGVWLVELAPVDDPQAVPGAVLNALGGRETVLHGTGAPAMEVLAAEGPRADPARQLVELCATREMLVILDNCEHLVQACADLAESLLTACRGVTVLATSREPLGVPGELVRPVDPLPDPTALRLLAERGAAASPGFDVSDDPEACAEICRRLDGLPLAIELAAARLRLMTPRQLADRLDGRFRLLTAGSRTVLPRQQTLRAVVDWSWDLLSDPERSLLARLSVFAGGCTLEAAERVCADPEVAPTAAGEVASVLGSLVDKSLVVADMTGAGARYRMLETIAEYAAERLHETEAETETASPGTALRHIRHYRELARTAALRLRGPDQLTCLDLLEREHDNIRAALRRAVERGAEQEALCLVHAMSGFWGLRNYGSEARSWCLAVADMGPDPFAEPLPAPVAVPGNILDAVPPLEPEVRVEARRGIRLYLLTFHDGDVRRLVDPESRRLGRSILAAYPADLPQSFRMPGLLRVFAVFLTGDFVNATTDGVGEQLDATVEGCRTHGFDWELAFALQLRAKVTNEMPARVERAAKDADESLALFTRLGDRWGTVEALSCQAEAARRRGDFTTAAEGYARAMALAEELGAHREVPMLTVRLGDTLISGDRPEEGERYVRAGVEAALAAAPQEQGAVFHGQVLLVTLLGRRGEFDRAREALDELAADARRTGFPGAGMLLGIRGWLEARAGDPCLGIRLMRGAYEDLEAHPLAEVLRVRMSAVMLPMCAVVLGLAAADGGCGEERTAERAAALAGAYDHHHGRNQGRNGIIDRQSLAEVESVLRGLLGDAGYEAEYAKGGGLSVEEATALVLG